MAKLFAQTILSMHNTCFPVGNLKFWHVLGRGYIHDQPLIKIWSIESVMNFSGRQHFSHVVIVHPWRN